MPDHWNLQEPATADVGAEPPRANQPGKLHRGRATEDSIDFTGLLDCRASNYSSGCRCPQAGHQRQESSRLPLRHHAVGVPCFSLAGLVIASPIASTCKNNFTSSRIQPGSRHVLDTGVFRKIFGQVHYGDLVTISLSSK